eukprot:COSAG03_NODE_24411_length_272_cov_0.895954_1_plen_38_part_10
MTTTGARHGTTADDTGPQTLMMLTMNGGLPLGGHHSIC